MGSEMCIRDRYDALTLVDALRVGQARERTAALSALDKVLGTRDAGDA